MAKSEKDVLKEIFVAQGLSIHTEPTEKAIKILSDYNYEKWVNELVSSDVPF